MLSGGSGRAFPWKPWLRWAVLLTAWVFALHCQGIQIVGGTSEVGNPNGKVIAQNPQDTNLTSKGKVTGFQIQSQGPAIQWQRQTTVDTAESR